VRLGNWAVLWLLKILDADGLGGSIMSIRVYAARGMTGRVKEDVVTEANADRLLLESAGITVLCPVHEEGVRATKKQLFSTKKHMDKYWPRDKEMIRDAHLLLNMSPHLPSMGVIREFGYARYSLWKKVITVFPEGQLPDESSICYYEDDYVTDSLIDAVMEIYRTHGTIWKRLKWKLGIINKSALKWMWYQIKEVWNAIH